MKTITVVVGAGTAKALDKYKKHCDKDCRTGGYPLSGLTAQLVTWGLFRVQEKVGWKLDAPLSCRD
jgi:hypothetical protein